MKKVIKEYDKEGNLIKETVIEKEEEEKYRYIPYYIYPDDITIDEPHIWTDKDNKKDYDNVTITVYK